MTSRSGARPATALALLALGLAGCSATTETVGTPGGGSTSIIPADRRTVWSPGIPGGIPVRSTVCATVTPAYAAAHGVVAFGTDGSGNAQPAIQYGIDSCPSGQVVYLPAGTYRLNSGLNMASGVVLRGAGATLSKLRLYNANDWVIGMMPGWPTWVAPKAITADAAKGATSVQVDTVTGLAVGNIVGIDQLDDTSYVYGGGLQYFKRVAGSTDYGPSSTGARSVGQFVEITGINGTTVSFSPELHLGRQASRTAQLWKVPAVLAWAGVEDLYVTGGTSGNIYMQDCAYCWVKNVESDGTSPGGADGTNGPGNGMTGDHIFMARTFRCVVRDNYVHHARSIVEGGGAYGISFANYSSDNLIENNIVNWLNKPLTMRASGGGNVIAYNYIDNAWTHNMSSMQETTIDMGHASFAHMELVEGNHAAQIATDIVWGNQGWMTIFRNRASGVQSRGGENDSVASIDFEAKAIGMNVVGNVLGTAGVGQVYEVHSDPPGRGQPTVWRIGNDATGGNGGNDQSAYEPYPFVPTYGGFPTTGYTLLRTANWDNVRNQIDADPGVPLPNSLYLTAKPAFFGSNPWPWVDPNGTTKVYVLPAKQRFDAGTPVR